MVSWRPLPRRIPHTTCHKPYNTSDEASTHTATLRILIAKLRGPQNKGFSSQQRHFLGQSGSYEVLSATSGLGPTPFILRGSLHESLTLKTQATPTTIRYPNMSHGVFCWHAPNKHSQNFPKKAAARLQLQPQCNQLQVVWEEEASLQKGHLRLTSYACVYVYTYVYSPAYIHKHIRMYMQGIESA